MAQILSLIFKDKDLCNALGFKGGTALMFFHNLPRFSTDLDLNLLNQRNDYHGKDGQDGGGVCQLVCRPSPQGQSKATDARIG